MGSKNLTWLDPFVVQHPELRIKRREDALHGQGQPICAVRLTKKDDSPTRLAGQHLQLWTSNLNYRYERYEGAFEVTEAVEPARRDVYDMDGHLLCEHGRAMRINLNVDFFRPDPPGPELPAYPSNIDFNRKQWVETGLLDQAIMRFFRSPFDWLFADPITRDMIATCERHGVSVVVNRYMMDASGLAQANTDREAEFRRIRKDGRFDGFILYESASIGGWDEQGNWCLTTDQARRVCRAFAETAP